MNYDQAYRKVHATLLDCHIEGLSATTSDEARANGPGIDDCWSELSQCLTPLCGHIIGGLRVPEAAIAGVAFAAMSTLAASELARQETERAVGPEVERLCNLAGGAPRG